MVPVACYWAALKLRLLFGCLPSLNMSFLKHQPLVSWRMDQLWILAKAATPPILVLIPAWSKKSSARSEHWRRDRRSGQGGWMSPYLIRLFAILHTVYCYTCIKSICLCGKMLFPPGSMLGLSRSSPRPRTWWTTRPSFCWWSWKVLEISVWKRDASQTAGVLLGFYLPRHLQTHRTHLTACLWCL